MLLCINNDVIGTYRHVASQTDQWIPSQKTRTLSVKEESNCTAINLTWCQPVSVTHQLISYLIESL